MSHRCLPQAWARVSVFQWRTFRASIQMAATTAQRWRMGFDIGGTFTDFILYDAISRRVHLHKRLTSSPDPSEAALIGLGELVEMAAIPLSDVSEIVHGTTLVTNAMKGRALRSGSSRLPDFATYSRWAVSNATTSSICFFSSPWRSLRGGAAGSGRTDRPRRPCGVVPRRGERQSCREATRFGWRSGDRRHVHQCVCQSRAREAYR